MIWKAQPFPRHARFGTRERLLILCITFSSQRQQYYVLTIRIDTKGRQNLGSLVDEAAGRPSCPADMLCSVCQSIFDWDVKGPRKLHVTGVHETLHGNIERSARTGCQICAHLTSKVKNAFTPVTPNNSQQAVGNDIRYRLEHRLVEHWEHATRFTLSFNVSVVSEALRSSDPPVAYQFLICSLKGS